MCLVLKTVRKKRQSTHLEQCLREEEVAAAASGTYEQEERKRSVRTRS